MSMITVDIAMDLHEINLEDKSHSHHIKNEEGFWGTEQITAFWAEGVTEVEKREALHPAHNICDQVLALRQRITFKGRSQVVMRSTEKIASTKIEEVDNEMLQQQLQICMQDAEVRAKSWASGNKAAKNTMVFLNDFTNYVASFSSVLEIMRGADQAYGGAGYAALSLVLSVAINKYRKEDIISSTMMNLRREYSRFELLSNIYPTIKMRKYIAQVYKLGIDFLQDAAMYYSRSSLRRGWEAISKPPFLLSNKANEISDAISEIIKERDTLLNQRVYELDQRSKDTNKRVYKLSQTTECLQQKIEKMQGDVDALHTKDENKRLIEIQGRLSRYHIQPNHTIDEYLQLLSTAFNRPPGLPCFDIFTIITQTPYTKWERNRKNCVLLLHGTTKADQTSCSWLSPAAKAVTSHLKGSVSTSKYAVVEIFCQKTNYMENDIPSQHVIVNIILQLLKEDLSILRNGQTFEDLQTRLGNLEPGMTGFDKACRILLDIARHFEQIYLIVDRVDRIKGNFVRTFTREVILKQTGATWKALFIASSDNKVIRENFKDLAEEMDEDKFTEIRCDQ